MPSYGQLSRTFDEETEPKAHIDRNYDPAKSEPSGQNGVFRLTLSAKLALHAPVSHPVDELCQGQQVQQSERASAV